MKKKCLFCDSYDLSIKYHYRGAAHPQESSQYFSNAEILSCNNCEISFCKGISRDQLDNYYKSIYKDKIYVKNRFFEFNSRFFSQVLFFINHFRISENDRVLEIGPNIQGILPTLKIFQKKLKYFYYDQLELKGTNGENIIKLGDYWDPNLLNLPELDIIWMSHSLEHIYPEDLQLVLSKYYECLSLGGKIFIEIPYDLKDYTFKVPHTLFFTKDGLINLLKKFGFKIIAVSEINEKREISLTTSNIDMNSSLKKIKKSLLMKTYLLLQKFLPDEFVKKFSFKNFVKNGPYTEFPIIRIIVQK